MPSEKEMEKRFREIDETDPYYRTAIVGITGTLASLSMSDSFSEAAGDDEAEELSKLVENMRLSYSNVVVKKNTKTRTQMRELMAQNDMIRERAFKRIYELPGFLEQPCTLKDAEGKPYSATYLDALMLAAAKEEELKELSGYSKAVKADPKLKDTLKPPVPDDRSVGVRTLFDDLALLDSKLHLGMKLPPLPREPERHTEEKSWKNYALAHLYNVPHEPDKKAKHLSKAMIGSLMAGGIRKDPAAEANRFTVDCARKAAAELRKLPAFQALCKDPQKVRSLLDQGRENPARLAVAVSDMQRPFAKCPEEQCRAMLEKLKRMEPMMDAPQGRSDKWKNFRESIAAIDLEPELKAGETREEKYREQLQSILDNTVKYTKGKKSLRKYEEDQNCFDQSLDVLSVLAEGGGEYARLTAQGIVDRTNEVRLGHDSRYRIIKLADFGTEHIAAHTNLKDMKQVRAYQNSFKEKKEPITRTVFDTIDYDLSDLPTAPKSMTENNSASVRTALGWLKNLNSNKYLSQPMVKDDIATALALADTKVYFKNSRAQGAQKVRISDAEYEANERKYQDDPALARLAEKYTDPEARKSLFDEARIPEKFEAEGVGPAEKPENPRGEVDYRPDIRTLKIDRLRQELAEIRLEMEKEKTQQQPEAAAGV